MKKSPSSLIHVSLSFLFLVLILPACTQVDKSDTFTINELGYIEKPGVSIMVYDDYYPSGAQSGLTIIQNGQRVAANGDLRLRGRPEVGEKKIDSIAGTIERQLSRL